MKQTIYTGLLLCAAGLLPAPLQAAAMTTPASNRTAAIQVGGIVVEYLICVRETHASGASWDTSAGACMGGTRTGEPRPAAAPAYGRGEVRR
jgi:hypothetical protein